MSHEHAAAAATTLADLYIAHSRDPDLRVVLAEYVAAHEALRRLAATLRKHDEGRFAGGIDSRANDLALYAARHIDALGGRQGV